MRYTAFGLGVAANASIPRLEGSRVSERADVSIQLGQRPSWFSPAMRAHLRYESPYRDAAGVPLSTLEEFDNGWLHHRFLDGADFIVEPRGREIWAAWPDRLDINEISSYLLGPVFGLVLRLRGSVCLHAGAVAVDGRAFALIGPSGAGKSTTVGAFAISGWPVLSDDVLPLARDEGRFVAYPGYPRIRLWPNSVRGLAEFSTAMPRLAPDWGERRFHLELTDQGCRFQHSRVPLAAIYVLEDRGANDGAPVVSAVTGNEALMALVTHSFASALLDRDMRAHDLATLAALAVALPVRRIRPSRGLDRLPDLVTVLLADFGAVAAA